MNVPPIPPPSVIETLILSKEFKGSKPFCFLFEPFNFDIRKATRFKKKTKTRKSLRVVTVFWLGKSNVFLPDPTYLLKKQDKRLKRRKFLHKFHLFVFMQPFLHQSLYKIFHILLPLLLQIFSKMRTKNYDYDDDFQMMSWPPKKSDAEKFIINIYLRCIKYFSLISIIKTFRFS